MKVKSKATASRQKKKRTKKVPRFSRLVKKLTEGLLYSFPVQLLINHIRNNQLLLLCWFFLFATVTGGFGRVFGIPYLFLDAEYIKEVNFWSFFIIGVSLGGFIMAFHITSYIMDGPKFSFLGLLTRPFTRFSINNAVIPTVFLIVYILCLFRFQVNNEFSGYNNVWVKVSGLLSGCFAMFTVLFSYFRFTNKDIFKIMASNVDRKIKRTPIARNKAMSRYKNAKSEALRIDNYLDTSLRIRKPGKRPFYLEKTAILKVFDQNHLNSVVIELLALITLLLLGVFRENPIFQIPAAASGILLLTIFLMFVGAVSYWFKSWAVTAAIGFVLLLNLLVKEEVVTKTYNAYGLNYEIAKADYSLSNIITLNSRENYAKDKAATLNILENWKNKFPEAAKPKMVFICSSGGGQRAALWALRSLQAADSVTNGQLMRNTMLMTGASGGLIGASYFRELYLRKQLGEPINLNASSYLDNIAQDMLNPLIFSLVVNDLFIRYQNFEYKGIKYPKDRGYAFEDQLNKNTGGIMHKSIGDYAVPERESIIPMMIMAPTVVNDGRKLFISPQHVSYMNLSEESGDNYMLQKVKGADFRYLFQNNHPDSLYFLTALRMNATFPYITPNITLPAEPPIEIMDAGLSDNFGINDAVSFLSVFKDWIAANTSGVIILSLRDSEKNEEIEKRAAPSLFEKVITPIRSLYNNWTNIQDINNDDQLKLAQLWYEGPIYRIDLEYITGTLFARQPLAPEKDGQETPAHKEIERASLSWHLTSLEKQNIIDNINLRRNQRALAKLKLLLEEE